MDNERKIIKFSAATGFTVVLEFGNDEEMNKYQNKIKGAGLQCETIPLRPLFSLVESNIFAGRSITSWGKTT